MAEPTRTDGLLQVRGLRIDHYDLLSRQPRSLVCGVDLDLAPGETLALVGPSGCGKSLTARALLGLLPSGLTWQGEISWQGQTLTDPDGRDWRAARGSGMGLILQEPQASLNPVVRVGKQIAETLQLHRGLTSGQAATAAVGLLAETRVPQPERAARQFPHQLSGGMRQRVLLAATLACDPQLLIADEPTTALDVSVQKDILALIRRLCQERDMALMFITHDLNLAPLLAERVAFMADGHLERVVPVADLEMPAPVKPLATAPQDAAPILQAKNISVSYSGANRLAVSGVDLELRPGQAVGLLGESGCGKTTLGRALSRQVTFQGGTLLLDGSDGLGLSGAAARAQRRRVQMLFQDPGGSLDPRQRVGAALREAGGAVGAAPGQLLAEVGLDPALEHRYPHQLSGGQRQRVALARCLATSPDVLIADEPTSALDAEARDLVLSLLEHIMRQRGLALLVISHDLEVLQGLCRQVHVMFAGLVVESLPAVSPFAPRHPYTRELVRALPRTLREDPDLWVQETFLPRTTEPIPSAGCPYFGNCRLQKPICAKELPSLKMVSKNHWLRCPEAEAEEPSHFIDT